MVAAAVANSGWVNSFDVGIELFLNHLNHKSPLLDWCMDLAAGSLFFRGGVLLLFVWYVLFDSEYAGQLRKDVELLLGAMLTSVLAMPVVRIVAYLLPYRSRPFVTPVLHSVPPIEGLPSVASWSSFPSDHAVLFCALATGVFFVSRRAGLLAYLWAALVICLPRLYVGLHWPTDILAGAAMGVGLASIALIPGFRRWTKRVICSQYSRHPALFCTILFSYSFQVVTLFGAARRFVAAALEHFKG